MTGIARYSSVITQNINYLNFPIKRLRLQDWIKAIQILLYFLHTNNTSLQQFLAYKQHLTGKGILKVKGWRKIFQSNGA
jgi:hypothetical protein